MRFPSSRLSVALVLLATAMATPLASSAASRYAGEFMAVGGGARALALGNAYVAMAEDATAGYWNPAGLAYLPNREAHLMHAERFGGQVQHDYLAWARPSARAWGFACTFTRVGVSDIAYTVLQDPSRPMGPENRPVVASMESSADYVAYLSAGRRLGRRLAVGASAKGVYRTVSGFRAHGAGIDLGLRYHVGNRVWAGATVRDAAATPIRWNTDATDTVHPSLVLGMAAPVPLGRGHATVLAGSRLGGDASSSSNNHAYNVGLEYRYRFLALRGGMDESHPSFGLGLRPHARIALDLAYLQHDDLESTYQVSATLRP